MRARPGPSARRRFGALLLGAAALLGAARPAAAGDPECWIGVILPGRSVEVGAEGRPASPVRATVRQVDPEVDAAAGLVFVEARLAVPSATAPGAAARVSPGAAPAISTCSEDARTLR